MVQQCSDISPLSLATAAHSQLCAGPTATMLLALHIQVRRFGCTAASGCCDCVKAIAHGLLFAAVLGSLLAVE